LTHDWLAWNSARWELGRRAVDRSAHPWEIEGGFEWDGWHAPGPDTPASPEDNASTSLRLPASYDFHFWHVKGRYGLAFGVPDDATLVDSERFSLWLLPGKQEMVCVRYND
jgi:hypothetical protein